MSCTKYVNKYLFTYLFYNHLFNQNNLNPNSEIVILQFIMQNDDDDDDDDVFL